MREAERFGQPAAGSRGEHRTQRWPGTGELLAAQARLVQDIAAQLRAADSVLLVTHEHPDGDAVGSSLAMLHALRLAGKRVTAYVPDAPPAQFSFLPGVDQLTCERPAADFAAVVVLDATYFARTHLADLLTAHPRTINIDHHYDNRREAYLNLVVPEAAATAQILAAFFAETATIVTKDMATCLLTGIFTDTGSFMHDSTTPDILKLAAGLMSKGARLSHIAHQTYQKKGVAGLRIWGRARRCRSSRRRTWPSAERRWTTCLAWSTCSIPCPTLPSRCS